MILYLLVSKIKKQTNAPKQIQTNENLNKDSILLKGILKANTLKVQNQLLELTAMNADNTKT